MLRLLVVGCLLGTCGAQLNAQGRDQYAEVRTRMVSEHIAAEGVTNARVLDSMRTVPRHLFVRPDLRKYAYLDQALDIGFKQTISPPFIVAYMTEMLDPQPTDRVLEIGTGSGYQAAVLSPLVQDVYTIEIVEPLGKRSGDLLRLLNYKNVHTHIGDGYLGWPDAAPFDKIIVTCSPEDVPTPLVEQLKEGGRMIIPLGERYQQVFHLLEKKDGKLERTRLVPTLFVPMTGKMEQLREVLPDGSKPMIVNGGFESTVNEAGLAEGWHYQRRSQLRTDDPREGSQYIQFENDVAGRSAHILQGMAIDGSKVERFTISWYLRSQNIRQGTGSREQPSLVLHFFDSRRLPIGTSVAGPWLADEPQWKRMSHTVVVPRDAREAILQVGLNGATGTLALDGFETSVVAR